MALAHPCALPLLLPILLHTGLPPNCSSPALLIRSKLPNNHCLATQQTLCSLTTVLNQVLKYSRNWLAFANHFLLNHKTFHNFLQVKMLLLSLLSPAFSDKNLGQWCSGLFNSTLVFSVGLILLDSWAQTGPCSTSLQWILNKCDKQIHQTKAS